MRTSALRVHLLAVDPLRGRAMTAALDGRADLRLTGSSPVNGDAAAICRRSRSQVALILGGALPVKVLTVIAALRDGTPRVESLVLTAAPSERERLVALLNAGARGILAEDVSADEIVRAARSVDQGGFVLGPEATEVALDRAAHAQREFIGAPLEPLDLEILGLLASGHSSVGVAKKLGVDAVTVRSTLRQAKRVLGQRTQEGVVSAAIRKGLI